MPPTLSPDTSQALLAAFLQASAQRDPQGQLTPEARAQLEALAHLAGDEKAQQELLQEAQTTRLALPSFGPRESHRPASPSADDDEDGRGLADYYADLLNIFYERGKTQGLLDLVAEDLAETGWQVSYDREQGQFVARPQRVQLSLVVRLSEEWTPYLGKRGEKKGQQIGWQKGGRVSYGLRKPGSSRERFAGKAVDVAGLKGKLAGHRQATGELSKAQLGNVKRAFAALKRHHGDLTMHRLEELHGELEKILAGTHPEGAMFGLRQRKLAELSHMLDMAEGQGLRGEAVGEATSPTTDVQEQPADLPSGKKEPWQMTKRDYVEQKVESAGKGAQSWMDKASRKERAKKAAEEEWEKVNESAYIDGKPTAEKPAWAKTGIEWANHPAGPGPLTDYHKGLVAAALAAGKPVPPEVLADYPDLQPPAAAPAAQPTHPGDVAGAVESLREKAGTFRSEQGAPLDGIPTWEIAKKTGLQGEDLFRALNELRKQGKLRLVAVGNAGEMSAAEHELAARNGPQHASHTEVFGIVELPEQPPAAAPAPAAQETPAVSGKGAGTAGASHPLAGLPRGEQVKRLVQLQGELADSPQADPLGTKGGPPPGLDMDAFKKDLQAEVAGHVKKVGSGNTLPHFYALMADKYGLSKHDFLRAVNVLHKQGEVRLGGWARSLDEYPDPELYTFVSGKGMGYLHPGDEMAANPDKYIQSAPENSPAGIDNAGLPDNNSPVEVAPTPAQEKTMTQQQELEHLETWLAANKGISGTGTINMMIKSLRKGRQDYTPEQVQQKIAEFESQQAKKSKRHEKTAYLKGYDVPKDGQYFDSYTVWHPGTGDKEYQGVKFVKEAPRGQALTHVYQKLTGDEYPTKIGSLVSAEKPAPVPAAVPQPPASKARATTPKAEKQQKQSQGGDPYYDENADWKYDSEFGTDRYPERREDSVPATEKQLALLRSFGVKVDGVDISKEQASLAIDLHKNGDGVSSAGLEYEGDYGSYPSNEQY